MVDPGPSVLTESSDEPTEVDLDLGLILQLENAVGEPEPMCLAVVRIDFDGCRFRDRVVSTDQSSLSDVAVAEAVEARLRLEMRRYDYVERIDDGGYIMVFRTLADSDVLRSRLERLYASLDRAYEIKGRPAAVPIALGAAVRFPAESAVDLFRRADRAARSTAEDGPTLA